MLRSQAPRNQELQQGLFRSSAAFIVFLDLADPDPKCAGGIKKKCSPKLDFWMFQQNCLFFLDFVSNFFLQIVTLIGHLPEVFWDAISAQRFLGPVTCLKFSGASSSQHLLGPDTCPKFRGWDTLVPHSPGIGRETHHKSPVPRHVGTITSKKISDTRRSWDELVPGDQRNDNALYRWLIRM